MSRFCSSGLNNVFLRQLTSFIVGYCSGRIRFYHYFRYFGIGYVIVAIGNLAMRDYPPERSSGGFFRVTIWSETSDLGRFGRIETTQIREASVWVRSDAEAYLLKPRRGEEMGKIEIALLPDVRGGVVMLSRRTEIGERREI